MENKITLEDLKGILADTALKMVTPVRVTKDTAGAYYPHLAEYPADLVRAACDYYVEGPDGKFFPSISDVLKNIREILRLAMGIPSPMEAWGMIQDAKRYQTAEWCRIGVLLRKETEGKTGAEYWRALARVSAHESECGFCHPSYDYDDFGHPAVAETIRRLGGKQYVITGSPAADRSRFADAYKEIIEREFRSITTSQSIRGFIESIGVKPGGLLESKVSALTARLSAPARKVSKGIGDRPIIPGHETSEDSKEIRDDRNDVVKQEKNYAYQE